MIWHTVIHYQYTKHISTLLYLHSIYVLQPCCCVMDPWDDTLWLVPNTHLLHCLWWKNTRHPSSLSHLELYIGMLWQTLSFFNCSSLWLSDLTADMKASERQKNQHKLDVLRSFAQSTSNKTWCSMYLLIIWIVLSNWVEELVSFLWLVICIPHAQTEIIHASFWLRSQFE